MSRPSWLRWRHLIAWGSIALYTASSAWLVGGALGRKYRSGLLAHSSPATAPAELATGLVGPIPAMVNPPVAIAAVPEAPAAPEPSQSMPESARPPLPTAEVVLDPEPPVKPSGLELFWESPEQKRVWDLNRRLTIEDERQLGATLHQAILKFHKPLLAGPLPGRLASAAEPFLKSVSRLGVNYRFIVLDCDEFNAFSHPGGYVYVCRGLLDSIAEDEDEALEFLVAHEIAHIDQAHAIICLRDPELSIKGLGTSPRVLLVDPPARLQGRPGTRSGPLGLSGDDQGRAVEV